MCAAELRVIRKTNSRVLLKVDAVLLIRPPSSIARISAAIGASTCTRAPPVRANWTRSEMYTSFLACAANSADHMQVTLMCATGRIAGIRVECNKGDMIVLPEGIYHRFTLDESNYIKVRSLHLMWCTTCLCCR